MTIEIQEVNGIRRSVYRQLDGSIEFADACSCGSEPKLNCPIDEHKIKARERES